MQYTWQLPLFHAALGLRAELPKDRPHFQTCLLVQKRVGGQGAEEKNEHHLGGLFLHNAICLPTVPARSRASL